MKDEIVQSTDNLYADLGHKDADKMQSKAILAMAIYRIIKKKKLTLSKASKLLGLTQDALSKILEGKVARLSVDRLMLILNQLGQDIDIKIKPMRKSRNSKRSIGKTSVHTKVSWRFPSPMAAKCR